MPQGIMASTTTPDAPRRIPVPLIALIVLTCSTPLAYALYTDHIWEDYFITFRYSRNLARGHGLVYTPGERVHGFTSPLGTLLPALFDSIAGSESYVPALWMYRILSIAAF